MYPHQSSNGEERVDWRSNGEERVDWRAQQQRNHSFHNTTGQFDMADETEPAAGPMTAFHQSMGGAVVRRGDLEYNNDTDEGLLYMEDDESPMISSSNSSTPLNRNNNNNNNNDGSSAGSSNNYTTPSSRRIGRGRRTTSNSRNSAFTPRMTAPNLGSHSVDNDSLSHSSGQQHQQSQHRQQPSQNSTDFLSAPYQDLMSEQQALEEQRQVIQRATSRRPPKRTPLPKAGLPMEPIIPVVEPTLPAAKLSKRGMIKGKARLPDLQVSVAPKPQTNNGGQVLDYVIDCAGCGCQLQIKKGTILVQCHACEQVYPTATCQVHAS
jgi:hypothetical protein